MSHIYRLKLSFFCVFTEHFTLSHFKSGSLLLSRVLVMEGDPLMLGVRGIVSNIVANSLFFQSQSSMWSLTYNMRSEMHGAHFFTRQCAILCQLPIQGGSF